MKYSVKSAQLTQFVVRLCYVLLAVSVILFPILMRAEEDSPWYFVMIAMHGKYLIYPFYAVVPAGYAALVCLDRILSNIKSDIVFDKSNIVLLNRITYCCLFAAAVGVVSYVIIALMYKSIETVMLLAFGEAFMALVVRVVRDVMQKAIEMKEDNDLVV
ncbi:MAG: DUF2975 domain-containing protein [Ruminococcaceae bacterium]|nr:DUF2975 domain-containing protein [Oscillospiraceae bacterium]